jgi:hypothetical protein
MDPGEKFGKMTPLITEVFIKREEITLRWYACLERSIWQNSSFV